MSDSEAAPGQYAQKGRLEIMLDEFSELHGTVLMGMHRELQTLKQEVQNTVDARLTEFLSQYAPAEDGLSASVSQARALELEVRELLNSVRTHQSDMAALQAKGEAQSKQQQADLAQTSARLLQELSQTGQQVTVRLIEEGRKSLDSNRDSLQKMLDDALGKMEAIQKGAKSVLGESRQANEKSNELLVSLRKEQAAHAAEMDRFNKLRLRITIGLGVALIATVGIWVWLTLTH